MGILIPDQKKRFRPTGLCIHGLRPFDFAQGGLHSFAASRLSNDTYFCPAVNDSYTFLFPSPQKEYNPRDLILLRISEINTSKTAAFFNRS
jgi:hypothetical protein